MKEQLEAIAKKAFEELAQSQDLKALDAVRVKYLGKKGELTAVLKGMKDVAPEDRPKVGQMVNETRAAIEAVLEENKEKKHYALAGGILQFHDNEMRILSDAIEGQHEIDIERARRAKERAEKRLAKKDEKTNINRAEVALTKAVNRIKVYEHH